MRVKSPPVTPAAAPAVRVVPADAVVTLDELRAVLGVPKSCLRREVRLGRLRVSRRAGRYWTTGAWVREWLEGGEYRPRQAALAATTD
jgi:hypothetical protein